VTSLPDGELETGQEMALALRRRRVSPRELLDRSLARAEAWQPAINAFSQLWPEEAGEDAQLVEVAARVLARSSHPAGGVRSPLAPEDMPFPAGVPVAVKDLFDVSGHETTGCCAAYRGAIALRDATMVERLRDAGMVIVGKTNQHELAHGGTNLVSACGRTGNPWDPRRMTGGSSGGSAAAVAAGIVPMALGSDTGGSIRIPASMCGTFGLKPTTGALSIEGMLPLAPSMDTPGPIAATASDLWMLYRIMADLPLADLEGPALALDRPITLGRVGGPFDVVHPDVAEAVEGAAAVFRSVGVAVAPAGPDDNVDQGIPDGLRGIWHRITDAEFLRAHPRAAARRDLVHPDVAVHFDHAEALTHEQLEEAQRRREAIGRWFRRRLENADALLIPTCPYPAPFAEQAEVDMGPAGMVAVDRVGPGWLTSSVNLAGLPAVNLPADRSSEGLPVGVTLVGRDGEEEGLLRLAALWERASGYRPPRPTLGPHAT
jgi:aspartyl-tRNA(Asn)/glutamyl-tRNA(Gln) amidotransferase subunit A